MAEPQDRLFSGLRALQESTFPKRRRNCACGLTLLENFYNRRDMSADGGKRRSIFKFLTKPWDDEALREQLRLAFLYHEAQAGKRG